MYNGNRKDTPPGVSALLKEQKLHFIGSKERLKCNITKQGGSLQENCRFTLLWRSTYFRRGLTFRIRGSYEKTEEGYLLRYRFQPTFATILWVSVPVLFFLFFAVLEFVDGFRDSTLYVCLFCLMYPAIALWQSVSCHKQFRKFFEVPTR